MLSLDGHHHEGHASNSEHVCFMVFGVFSKAVAHFPLMFDNDGGATSGTGWRRLKFILTS